MGVCSETADLPPTGQEAASCSPLSAPALPCPARPSSSPRRGRRLHCCTASGVDGVSRTGFAGTPSCLYAKDGRIRARWSTTAGTVAPSAVVTSTCIHTYTLPHMLITSHTRRANRECLRTPRKHARITQSHPNLALATLPRTHPLLLRLLLPHAPSNPAPCIVICSISRKTRAHARRRPVEWFAAPLTCFPRGKPSCRAVPRRCVGLAAEESLSQPHRPGGLGVSSTGSLGPAHAKEKGGSRCRATCVRDPGCALAGARGPPSVSVVCAHLRQARLSAGVRGRCGELGGVVATSFNTNETRTGG